MISPFRARPAASTLCVALAVFALLVAPGILFAHAHLTRSDPAANGRLDRTPASITLWFSENPEPRFTSVQLLDASGAPHTLGAVARVAGDAAAVRFTVDGSLPSGTYTVAWRTAGSDGHASSGKFTFTVAAAVVAPVVEPAPATADTTKPLTKPAAPPVPNAVTGSIPSKDSLNGVDAAERWAELMAILTVIGAIVFRNTVVPGATLHPAVEADAVDRARRLAQGALLLALVASLTRLAAATALVPAGTGNAWMQVIRATAWGHGWLIGAAGIVVAGLGLSIARKAPGGWLLAGVGVVALMLSAPLTGHAAATNVQREMSIASDFLHLAGVGTWIGGLLLIVFAGLPAISTALPTDRPELGQRLVRSYHRVAVVGVTVAALTGVINAKYRLGTWSAIATSSYGRILIIKLVGVLLLLAFGAYHWRTVVTATWPSRPSDRFRSSALLEAVCGAIILAVTAVLLSSPLPGS